MNISNSALNKPNVDISSGGKYILLFNCIHNRFHVYLPIQQIQNPFDHVQLRRPRLCDIVHSDVIIMVINKAKNCNLIDQVKVSLVPREVVLNFIDKIWSNSDYNFQAMQRTWQSRLFATFLRCKRYMMELPTHWIVKKAWECLFSTRWDQNPQMIDSHGTYRNNPNSNYTNL